jgi:hypothetical protein
MVAFSGHRKWGRLVFGLAAAINLYCRHIDIVIPHPFVTPPYSRTHLYKRILTCSIDFKTWFLIRGAMRTGYV